MIFDKPLYIRVQEMEDKLLLEFLKNIKRNERAPLIREVKRFTEIGLTSTTHAYMGDQSRPRFNNLFIRNVEKK
ncbi:hypothetical protein AC625_12600 [Peribacillus loiseleuriae]|uniref:Uncharacterized protein n=1 Tax=Peribacillus loiseleuriae TaxID=1679170 RepID=A0A0K9GU69_9BACI|nr:hypothetical protein AC625_12600 [Peribacillus loiseleuriae]